MCIYIYIHILYVHISAGGILAETLAAEPTCVKHMILILVSPLVRASNVRGLFW